MHEILVSDWLVIFMGFMILVAGAVVGGGIVGLLWLRQWYKDLQYTLSHMKIEPTE